MYKTINFCIIYFNIYTYIYIYIYVYIICVYIYIYMYIHKMWRATHLNLVTAQLDSISFAEILGWLCDARHVRRFELIPI